MKLSKDFDTSIDELLDCVTDKTVFLSDWNKGSYAAEIDIEPFNLSTQYHQSKNKYFFSDEFQTLKEVYAPSFSDDSSLLPSNQFSVVSNCTIAGYLVMYYLHELFAKQNQKLCPLILAPSYFSYIKILNEMNAEIYYVNCYNNLHILEDIQQTLKVAPVNLILVTEPLFGTGISVSHNILSTLSNLCEKGNKYLFIDYTYGGMTWTDRKCAQDDFFLHLGQNKHTVVIGSLCKRVYLNGIKYGIIEANPKMTYEIEKKSVYLAGCLSEQQILLYKQLHKVENRKYILDLINQNNQHYQNNYELIKTLLSNTPFLISPCTCGYFTVIGIPKKTKESNMKIAKQILKQTNILTIPHDRYIFDCDKNYYFRVNLSLSQEKLIYAVHILLQSYFDGIK